MSYRPYASHVTPSPLEVFASIKGSAEQWLIVSLADCRSVHGALRTRERARVREAVEALRRAKARHQQRWNLFIAENNKKEGY